MCIPSNFGTRIETLLDARVPEFFDEDVVRDDQGKVDFAASAKANGAKLSYRGATNRAGSDNTLLALAVTVAGPTLGVAAAISGEGSVRERATNLGIGLAAGVAGAVAIQPAIYLDALETVGAAVQPLKNAVDYAFYKFASVLAPK